MPRLLERLIQDLELSAERPPDAEQWRFLMAEVQRASVRAEVLSESNFRAVVERSPDPIFVQREGSILYANPAMAQTLGYDDAADLAGPVPFVTIVHPDDWERLAAYRTRRQAGESVGSVEVRWLRRDGQVLHVQAVSTPITFDDQPSMLTMVRDVTARILAEQQREQVERALRLSEERYRVLFEDSPLPILLFDPESFELLGVNDASVHLYGYSREELLTMRLTALKGAEDDPDLLTAARRATAKEQALRAGGPREPAWHGTKRHRKKDGTIFDIEVTSHPVVLDGRPAILSIGVEVTETRRLEEQLRQAQKMEAVGQLAGGVAHDFNNLLATVLSYADLAQAELGPKNPVSADLAQISAAARRGADLTRQLLAFSRQTPVQARVMSLNTTVAGVASMLRRLIGENVAVTTRLDEGLGAVKADPGQLDQVLLNLAVNARDAMPEGGSLVIETRNAELDEAAAQAAGVCPGSYVLLSVSDTGSGMDAATQARMFEPFFTTKEVGKGTGLGLSTVFGIVKQSKGGVTVRSEQGKGTTFDVVLPRVAATRPSLPAKPAAVERGSATVLLVEDDDQVRNVVRRLLMMRGYAVIVAAGPRAALDILESRSETIHLLVTDVVMPEMDGRTLAKKVRESYPHMKVLFMSGYTEHIAVKGAALGPADHFMQKPFSVQQLADAVRDALNDAATPAAK